MHTPDDLTEALTPPPLATDDGRAPNGIRSMLAEMWLKHLNNAVIARGEPTFDFDALCLSEDAIRISKAVTYLRRIRAEAHETFAPMASPFHRMRFAATDQQRRHFRKKVMTAVEIQKATEGKRRPSIFYSGVQPAHLEEVMWDVLDQRFWELVGKADEFVDVDAICPIGASGGAATQFIRFRMQLSAGVAHAHPVSEGQSDPAVGDKGIIYCSSDILQGVPRSQ